MLILVYKIITKKVYDSKMLKKFFGGKVSKSKYNNELKCEKKIPVSNMCLGDCTITSKAKINIFENVSSVPGSPSETFHSIFFQKMLTLAFEANDVLSCQN